MNRRTHLITLTAFVAGAFLGYLTPRRTSPTVYIKEFLTVDATTGESINCSIATPPMSPDQQRQLLVEQPPGGPYRVTTSVKALSRLPLEAQGYNPLVIELDPYKHSLSISGRISVDTIKMEKIHNHQMQNFGTDVPNSDL